jgi:hypothetical protein
VTAAGGRRRHGALRSFLVGGVLGAAATVLATPRLRRPRDAGDGPRSVVGLEAFEGAPCWEHDRRRAAGERGG